MNIKNRNLFRITRFILFRFSGLFKLLAKYRVPQKRLLIIKTDAIGDYILFRNFIEVIRQSAVFKDYKIDLLGNKLWQDLALHYDSPFIDEFLFIRPDDLYESPRKTTNLAWKLYKKKYQIVLQPSFSRTFINDGLAGFSAAKQIIGFAGDTERISPKYKAKTNKFYTEMLSLPPGVDFEFERSRFFVESVLKHPVNISNPVISYENNVRQGIVIFPGAGVFKRAWGAEKFLELIKRIKQHTSMPVYLVGGPAEMATGDYLMANLPPGSADNLTGKTSLLQLVNLIGNATLIIANETSAVHIAAATQTKAICILGGGHFGRFAPYPEHIISKPLCAYEKMDCYNCNWNCKFETRENASYPCISNVRLEMVWMAILQLLPTE
ncbi:MAG: glycosyltransferase family 9 protein [Sphingobacteriales bacterium]